MKKEDTINDKITVSIKNKKEQLFLGEAFSITSKNDRGVFDILPLHVNFITLIYDFIVIDRNLDTEKRFEIESGILYTLGNKIDIYIGL
jgi:F0F1-type ATP synthase epsilon subunit